jgi:hypothetical protein
MYLSTLRSNNVQDASGFTDVKVCKGKATRKYFAHLCVEMKMQ